MKKLELALLLGLAASICCSSLAKTADSRSKLEENVLRLHVLANSDSIDDQALKLKVRDKVLAYAGELLTHPGESLEAVEEVRFLVDGEFSETYGPVTLPGGP